MHCCMSLASAPARFQLRCSDASVCLLVGAATRVQARCRLPLHEAYVAQSSQLGAARVAMHLMQDSERLCLGRYRHDRPYRAQATLWQTSVGYCLRRTDKCNSQRLSCVAFTGSPLSLQGSGLSVASTRCLHEAEVKGNRFYPRLAQRLPLLPSGQLQLQKPAGCVSTAP